MAISDYHDICAFTLFGPLYTVEPDYTTVNFNRGPNWWDRTVYQVPKRTLPTLSYPAFGIRTSTPSRMFTVLWLSRSVIR